MVDFLILIKVIKNDSLRLDVDSLVFLIMSLSILNKEELLNVFSLKSYLFHCLLQKNKKYEKHRFNYFARFLAFIMHKFIKLSLLQILAWCKSFRSRDIKRFITFLVEVVWVRSNIKSSLKLPARKNHYSTKFRIKT